uniref:histidine kinase dimerization/phospho-acceptor domain-containing protein n=1 Tax=Acetatifactor sp. TaxID=1872090 RepID=UPI0040577146
MKKPTAKRFGLGLLQHLLAAAIMLIIAAIMFHSYVAVKSMNETKTYMINFYGKEDVFEESELFQNIFATAVSDISRLVVVKGQLETDGEFDGTRQIDVTEYANRKGNGNNCPVTAVYQLDDLIKWGINGIEYNQIPWSISDFVNYFGTAVNPANYGIDAYGDLYFVGFIDVTTETSESIVAKLTEASAIDSTTEGLDAQTQMLCKMSEYTMGQLEDMAFSYIMKEVPQGISPSREDDGTQTVYLTALNCRYKTVDGEKQLFAYANNWIDYMKLQNNVADAITNLSANYELYQNCNELYQEKNSNLKYAVRMMTEDGLRTYTNVSELMNAEENEITEYFEEYRRYFIYYPDSMEFTGNTDLAGDDVYDMIREYEYAYPETTHIWVGVDTAYPIEGDAFYEANAVFGKIVPHLELIVAAIALLFLGWFGIGVYLTITAGIKYNEDGERGYYLNSMDKLWTEVSVFLSVCFGYLAMTAFRRLIEYTNNAYISQSEIIEIFSETNLYKYGIFALYGFIVSMFLNLFWYSFVRKFRMEKIWKGSFIYCILQKVCGAIDFILSHGNTALSTLLPYNLFILVNMLGILAIYIMRTQIWSVVGILSLLVAFDGSIGVMLFRNSAERNDIVKGIKRIRDGEVDYKLDVESLHGSNREMADAVNNIGEGIRKAVRTSMKDEQMKTDLITNVSHDIKTPLTSIISYVDLLKRLKIEMEPAKSYIAVLDSKSQRLKQLTDDLVEASKISSGNIELHMEQLNLAELLNQSIGEFSEKLEDKRLQVVFEGQDVPACIFADSRRMWRVIENLFNNICKYAMESTRVYIDLVAENEKVKLSIKNISERQMNIRADELTERFIRGDESRTTEGSGLGLSIAKSLIEVQGGNFIIYLDGDLFKVDIEFPEYKMPEEEEIKSDN